MDSTSPTSFHSDSSTATTNSALSSTYGQSPVQQQATPAPTAVKANRKLTVGQKLWLAKEILTKNSNCDELSKTYAISKPLITKYARLARKGKHIRESAGRPSLFKDYVINKIKEVIRTSPTILSDEAIRQLVLKEFMVASNIQKEKLLGQSADQGTSSNGNSASTQSDESQQDVQSHAPNGLAFTDEELASFRTQSLAGCARTARRYSSLLRAYRDELRASRAAQPLLQPILPHYTHSN